MRNRKGPLKEKRWQKTTIKVYEHLKGETWVAILRCASLTSLRSPAIWGYFWNMGWGLTLPASGCTSGIESWVRHLRIRAAPGDSVAYRGSFTLKVVLLSLQCAGFSCSLPWPQMPVCLAMQSWNYSVMGWRKHMSRGNRWKAWVRGGEALHNEKDSKMVWGWLLSLYTEAEAGMLEVSEAVDVNPAYKDD